MVDTIRDKCSVGGNDHTSPILESCYESNSYVALQIAIDGMSTLSKYATPDTPIGNCNSSTFQFSCLLFSWSIHR